MSMMKYEDLVINQKLYTIFDNAPSTLTFTGKALVFDESGQTISVTSPERFNDIQLANDTSPEFRLHSSESELKQSIMGQLHALVEKTLENGGSSIHAIQAVAEIAEKKPYMEDVMFEFLANFIASSTEL